MRIRYGISNAHYAIATAGSGGALTYAAPVPMPGAVAISLEASGEETTEYADNVEWFIQALNNGYTGTLELEEIPEMVISAESRDLRFFYKEELKEIEVVITHSDIVEDWFINK